MRWDCLNDLMNALPKFKSAVEAVGRTRTEYAKAMNQTSVAHDMNELAIGYLARARLGPMTVAYNTVSNVGNQLRLGVNDYVMFALDKVPLWGDKALPPLSYYLPIVSTSHDLGRGMMMDFMSRAVTNGELARALSGGRPVEVARAVARTAVDPLPAAEARAALEDLGMAAHTAQTLFKNSKEQALNTDAGKSIAEQIFDMHVSPEAGLMANSFAVAMQVLGAPLRYVGATDMPAKILRYTSTLAHHEGVALYREMEASGRVIPPDAFVDALRSRVAARLKNDQTNPVALREANESSFTQDLQTPLWRSVAAGKIPLTDLPIPFIRYYQSFLGFMARSGEQVTTSLLPRFMQNGKHGIFNATKNKQLLADLASDDPLTRVKAKNRTVLALGAVGTALALGTVTPYSRRNKSAEAASDVEEVATTGGTRFTPGTVTVGTVSIPLSSLPPTTASVLNGIGTIRDMLEREMDKQHTEDEYENLAWEAVTDVIGATAYVLNDSTGLKQYFDTLATAWMAVQRGSGFASAAGGAVRPVVASALSPKAVADPLRLVMGDDMAHNADNLMDRVAVQWGEGSGVPYHRDPFTGKPIRNPDNFRVMREDLPVYLQAVQPGGGYEDAGRLLAAVNFSGHFRQNKAYNLAGDAGNKGEFYGFIDGQRDTVKLNARQRDALEFLQAGSYRAGGRLQPSLLAQLDQLAKNLPESATAGETVHAIRDMMAERREKAKQILRFHPLYGNKEGKSIYDEQTDILLYYGRSEKRWDEATQTKFLNMREKTKRTVQAMFADIYSREVPN